MLLASPTSLHLAGAFKRTSQPAFCLHSESMMPGRGGNCLRGNPSRLGTLLHWTYLLSLWGDFKSVKKRQQLSDGDHLQVTRCKEGRSLPAAETNLSCWKAELSHCGGAAMGRFRVKGEKRNPPQPSKCCASFRKPLWRCSRCRRHRCADGSQIDFMLHHVQDHLNSSALSPKRIINHPPPALA